MEKNDDLVCDRCGSLKGMCHHKYTYDYRLQTRFDFNKELYYFRALSLFIVILAISLGGILFYVNN